MHGVEFMVTKATPQKESSERNSMPAQLVALTEGPSILIDKAILLLGRHPECDIQIDSRKISRRHCCIAQVGDAIIVRDLGSTNGIRINGVRVVEGRLNSGDELTIGNSRYRLSLDAVPLPPRPSLPKESPRVVEARSDEDMLESCDEPVPLSDPGAPVRVAAPAPGHPPPPRRTEMDPFEAVAETATGRNDHEHSDERVLPERLELAPISDIFPQPSPPPNE
jgi:pSer/pThr/pTyr-binding forkhead associated (FHA) protein